MDKILLFTSQDVGNDVISGFQRRKNTELVVVTQRTLRDEIYGYRSSIDYCARKRIRCLTPDKLDDSFIETVATLAPDIIVDAYYPKIFPSRLLKIPPRGCINVHPGLLPHYRGKFPTPWCILNEEKDFGVTIHRLDSGIDTGDMLVQRRYPIGDDETGHELYLRAMKRCGEFLLEQFDGIFSGKIKARPQAPGGSYYNRIEHQFRIDWQQPRRHVRNRIRVHARPYFPAHSFLFNSCLLINRASFYEPEGYRSLGPGLICEVLADKTFAVSCADGCLRVEDYEVCPRLTMKQFKLQLQVGARLT